MKSVLFVVAVMVAAVAEACGGGNSDLHDVTTCGSDWGSGYAGCERACASRQGAAPDGSNHCLATDPRDGSAYDCLDGSFVIDGVRGCCPSALPGGSGGLLRFFECN